jgi:hypothetical protein
MITNLVSEHGRELPHGIIWDEIVEGNTISGHYNKKRPNEYR